MNQKAQKVQAANSAMGLIVFCGLLTTLSAFSTDIVLPAFQSMTEDLNAPIIWVQGTIPAFSASFAVAQMVLGPASDRFGRRSIIAVGLVICLIGIVVATLGETVTQVLIGRAIQGFGCAAGPVLARAILRDTHSGERLANAMAITMAIFAIGPLTAPLLGYFLTEAFGWRAVFVAMATLTVCLLALSFLWLTETLPEDRRQILTLDKLMRSSADIFGHSQSRYFLVVVSLAYCALLSFVANAPRIYESQFEVVGLEFSVLFAGAGLGIIIGQIGNRIMLRKFGILPSLRLATFILFFSTAVSAVLAVSDTLSANLFTALMFLFNTSFLVVLANGSTLIIDPHPNIAGIASAFFGFVTLSAASIYTVSTFSLFDGDLLYWALAMSALSALAFAGTLFRRSNSIQLSA